MNEIFELLISAYQEKVSPLKNRISEIEAQKALLSDPDPGRTAQAQIAVMERKIEEALADGRPDEVKALELDLAKLEEAHRETERNKASQILILNEEREGINKKIAQAGSETLIEVYPKIRETVLKKWTAACDASEEAWKDLLEFQKETGAQLSLSLHLDGLGPSSVSALGDRVRKWT